MKNFPIEKYKFVQYGNKITAITRYGGKIVKATATCHPDDVFDVEFGKKLAAARCNAKVAQRRYNHNLDRLTEAHAINAEHLRMMHKLSQYAIESEIALVNAMDAEAELLASVGC